LQRYEVANKNLIDANGKAYEEIERLTKEGVEDRHDLNIQLDRVCRALAGLTSHACVERVMKGEEGWGVNI
jgi:hypothetical protein